MRKQQSATVATGEHKPDSAPLGGSPSRVALQNTPTGRATLEVWDTFLKHELDYNQALAVMAAITHSIGKKIGDEEGAVVALIRKCTKLVPSLLEKVE